MQASAMGKIHHPLQKLGPVAMIFRTIIKIDNQRGDLREALTDDFPPLRYAIGQAVTGDFGEHAIEKDFLQGRHEESHGSVRGFRLKSVSTGGGPHAAFAAADKRTDFDSRFRIEGNAQDLRSRISLTIDVG